MTEFDEQVEIEIEQHLGTYKEPKGHLDKDKTRKDTIRTNAIKKPLDRRMGPVYGSTESGRFKKVTVKQDGQNYYDFIPVTPSRRLERRTGEIEIAQGLADALDHIELQAELDALSYVSRGLTDRDRAKLTAYFNAGTIDVTEFAERMEESGLNALTLLDNYKEQQGL